MSNNQLQANIEKFKLNKANFLIATSVVEEGLDISSCSRVICLNEIMTVKQFIQMKGRARQKESDFLFLVNKEMEMEVE